MNEELEQDLGTGFQFSEDADALQSILSNTGISQAQVSCRRDVICSQLEKGNTTKKYANKSW